LSWRGRRGVRLGRRRGLLLFVRSWGNFRGFWGKMHDIGGVLRGLSARRPLCAWGRHGGVEVKPLPLHQSLVWRGHSELSRSFTPPDLGAHDRAAFALALRRRSPAHLVLVEAEADRTDTHEPCQRLAAGGTPGGTAGRHPAGHPLSYCQPGPNTGHSHEQRHRRGFGLCGSTLRQSWSPDARHSQFGGPGLLRCSTECTPRARYRRARQ
jgi:hypothetical protein